MKHRKDFKEGLVIIVCALMLGCNNSPAATDTGYIEELKPVSKPPQPVINDSLQKAAGLSGNTNIRQITAADEQYLTLIIPDYSEIVFRHETGKETLNYVKTLKQYFILRECSINGDTVIKDTTKDANKKRFYIQHVGDNRFVITVYDEYGDENHP